MCLPIMKLEGSNETVLVEQGKILSSDKRFYINGDVSLLAPSQGAIKIGLGSPVYEEHSLIPDGVQKWPPLGDVIVYQKVYGRVLPTGSFIGEY